MKVTLAMSGCGWRFNFHMGALKAFDEANIIVEKISVASASAFVGAGYLVGLTPQEMHEQSLSEVPSYKHEFIISSNMVKILKRIIAAQIAKVPNAYEIISNRLYISVTKFPLKNEIITEFNDHDHLQSALLATCWVPIYMQHIPKIKNNYYYDGSVSNNFYKINEDTIRCGFKMPHDFLTHVHIEPSIKTSTYHTFVPNTTTMQLLYDDGYFQAKKYIEKHLI